MTLNIANDIIKVRIVSELLYFDKFQDIKIYPWKEKVQKNHKSIMLVLHYISIGETTLINKYFDKRQTNIAKGIAIILLLWHHLFHKDAETINSFVSMFVFDGGTPIETYISTFSKVCVAMFLLLSGYGLYKSYTSYLKKKSSIEKSNVYLDFIFVKNHILNLLNKFWIIFIIFVPMGMFFGRNFIICYDSNLLYGIVDFLGLASIFSFPTMNSTWWFMGTIILFYILFPILIKIMNYSAELLLILVIGLLFLPYITPLFLIIYFGFLLLYLECICLNMIFSIRLLPN